MTFGFIVSVCEYSIQSRYTVPIMLATCSVVGIIFGIDYYSKKYLNAIDKIECKNTNIFCDNHPQIISFIKIYYNNIFNYSYYESTYCGRCHTFEEVINMYKHYSIIGLEISNIQITELTNFPNLKTIRLFKCNLLESVHDLPSLECISVNNCPLLKRVYNIPSINKDKILASRCDLLTELPFYDDPLKNEYYNVENIKINNCKWLSNNVDLDGLFICIMDDPLAVRIKKVIIIQRLCRWRAIKKILYKKASKSVVDFIIRKFYI
jgi:hypothetical protein